MFKDAALDILLTSALFFANHVMTVVRHDVLLLVYYIFVVPCILFIDFEDLLGRDLHTRSSMLEDVFLCYVNTFVILEN